MQMEVHYQSSYVLKYNYFKKQVMKNNLGYFYDNNIPLSRYIYGLNKMIYLDWNVWNWIIEI